MQLQRPEKILVAMRVLSGGTTRPLKYEDIVVKAFEMFPEDFALRGHPEYPDASDIHKPLYGPLKRAGHVLSANKMFRLTAKGLATASQLTATSSGPADRLDRVNEAELARIYDTEAFRLFAEGKGESILDTDFFAYLGTTVRTPRNEFLGRLKAVEDAVSLHGASSDDRRRAIARELHRFMTEQFSEIIERKRGRDA